MRNCKMYSSNWIYKKNKNFIKEFMKVGYTIVFRESVHSHKVMLALHHHTEVAVPFWSFKK